MIKNFINKILGRTDTSQIAKVKEAISGHGNAKFSNKADYYFADTFTYERDEYSEFKESLKSNHQFYPLTKDWKKDIEKDNVEFYLISDLGKYFFISLFDPFEYLSKSEVLDIFDFKPSDIKLDSLILI